MIWAVASGKGGTGKTLVSTSLALALAATGQSVTLLDCDVEAPNAHIFLSPTWDRQEEVVLQVPVIMADQCTYCGKCSAACAFHALAIAGQTAIVFDDLCHGCGACILVCPQAAIVEIPHPIGQIDWGHAGSLVVGRGTLFISKPLAVPIIRQLLDRRPSTHFTILDAPPGNACSLVATISAADHTLLITEPTPFGLHDLKLAWQVTQDLGKPVGLIINKFTGPYPPLEDFCRQANLPILLRIPLSRKIAEQYATGIPLLQIMPQYQEAFVQIARSQEAFNP